MNNDALVAALGTDAVTAVHGYRLGVVVEAERRGLWLVSETSSGDGKGPNDPIDIALTFRHCPGRAELAGRTVRWSPAHGWSMSHRTVNAPLSYFAGAHDGPLCLVPTAAEVVEWATGESDGPAAPPVRIELDDDPEAIHRLLGFVRAGRDRRQFEASARGT